MNETAVVEQPGSLPAITYTQAQVDLIKRMYAKDASDDELAAFMYAAKRLKLDIIARQIHFTKRQGKPVFIVAIDGYRLNAERTGMYAPGKEPSYTYDGTKVVSATAYVKKYINGEWHEIGATAFMAEYKPSDDGSAFMWNKMPHNQLAKCAEALALRRAFPNELSDTITEDEAAQTRELAGKEPIKPATPKDGADPYTVIFVPTEVNEASSKPGADKAWTKWGTVLPDGKKIGTFNEEFGFILVQARDHKTTVKLTWKPDGKYFTIAALETVQSADAPGDAQE